MFGDFLDEGIALKRVSPVEAQVLAGQSIGELAPGPIVHDFQALIDFIGGGELRVSGKHRLLPIKILPELNARMSQPLAVQLRRPQLRSFPNLQQLYLLLRASGIGVIRGAGADAKLTLDPTLVASWE